MLIRRKRLIEFTSKLLAMMYFPNSRIFRVSCLEILFYQFSWKVVEQVGRFIMQQHCWWPSYWNKFKLNLGPKLFLSGYLLHYKTILFGFMITRVMWFSRNIFSKKECLLSGISRIREGEAPARICWPFSHHIIVHRISRFLLKNHNICIFFGHFFHSP